MEAKKRGLKRITIADVAREAGLSPTTVSHSLNGRGQVNSQTIRHVKDVAARLHYRPSARAQSLRTGRSRTVALLSSMPSAVSAGISQLGFFTELAVGAARTALLRGYVLSLVPPVDRSDVLSAVDMDGALLLEPAPDDALMRELEERRIPFVTIGGRAGRSNIDLRHGAVADLLLQHLSERGAHAVGLVLGVSGRESQRAFRAAYLKAADQCGFPAVIVEAAEGGGEEAGYRATQQLLADYPEVDGLCVPIDAFASGAARAATTCGRQVGRDLLLATRYNGLRAQTCVPPITAVDLHLDAVARAALDSLLNVLTEDAPRPVAEVPEPTLVVRASTRP